MTQAGYVPRERFCRRCKKLFMATTSNSWYCPECKAKPKGEGQMTTTLDGKQYKDEELVCQDCGKPFIYTAGEQEFFASKGFTPPKRCNECRKANRKEKDRQRAERSMPSQPDQPRTGRRDRR